MPTRTPRTSRGCSTPSPPTSRARRRGARRRPFDTELFGHWWFEGPDFLAATYRRLPRPARRAPEHRLGSTCRASARRRVAAAGGLVGRQRRLQHVAERADGLDLGAALAARGRFWDVAPAALARPAHAHVLAQAARELLLAQSSDWQFIISTGAVADYAVRRFNGTATTRSGSSRRCGRVTKGAAGGARGRRG